MTERRVEKGENKAEVLKAFQEDHPGKSIIQVSNGNGTRLIASEAFAAAGEEFRESVTIPEKKPEMGSAPQPEPTRPITIIVSDVNTGTRIIEAQGNLVPAGEDARHMQLG